MKSLTRCIILVSALLDSLADKGWGSEVTLYQIGNSHTWDSAPSDGLVELFLSAGFDLANGWHVRCSRPLSYILSNPEDVCVPSNEFGMWTEALTTQRWDSIILQSYYGASGQNELDAFTAMLALRPSHYSSNIYLFVNWPSISEQEYRNGWSATYEAELQSANLSHAYFVWLVSRLRERLGAEYNIRCIPVGAVFAELDTRFRQGQYPPFESAEDLYRDTEHLNNVGRYIVGLTILASVTNYDVRLLEAAPLYYNNFYSHFIDIETDLANYLQGVVWNIMNAKPFEAESIPFNQSFDITASEVQFSFQTFLGYDYTILKSVDLQTWTLSAYKIPGDGKRWVQSGHPRQQFYRILRE